MQTDDRRGDDYDDPNDDHNHEQNVCAGLNDGDTATALVGTDEQSLGIATRRDEAAGMGALAVLRNEPKDVNRASGGTTSDARGSLRNEPTVVSEAVAPARRNGDEGRWGWAVWWCCETNPRT